MKILLTSINAKFIHSNLAIHSIRAYSKEYEKNIQIREFTINNSVDDILREIYKENPNVLAISTYIWNIEMVKDIIIEIKKILPNIEIWLGGPEVSFDSEKQLERYNMIKGIITGEGEGIFKDITSYYVDGQPSLNKIQGIVFRDQARIINTGIRPILDINTIPFAYEEIIETFENKIIYYESSRGCPFSCQYCLSSIERAVRFRDLDLVKIELKQFIQASVKQVKFVDRTFNCKKEHALGIWNFLKENDNGFTNFHFEIAADLIDEDMLEFLSTVRQGLFQFEIGVQSTNEATLDIIQRKTNFSKLSQAVKALNTFQNIHQHLDLIAGLPKEDYNTFKKSFNDVYALAPEQLQLGFLKVLKGSGIFNRKEELGIVHRDKPPYEVITTKELTYGEIQTLKMIEEMVEIYYNSGQFTHTIKFIEKYFVNPFEMFESMANYYEKNNLNTLQHSRIARYDILLEYFNTHIEKNNKVIEEILILDLYLQENLKKRPEWAQEKEEYKESIKDFYKESENITQYLPQYKGYTAKQITRMTHIETFTVDIMKFIKTKEIVSGEKPTFILFDYLDRNPLNHHAKIKQIPL
ncbi:radical SAM superfamily enzyme YgiQ (UPF0313 family) [Natranaerovirga pectinivora]|uniref:Radical SAM superfamily enzyme YgiQ (UPF0313 family) n=1 Tax=Natranaerovirga pectinivora TaxID=682400 RepID=A0A4R3MES4_9FIRM|nr:B12-binding domain-containing radical SAM protein [Natranaerovirga pectinivora]TCT12164.1 radical SAM superfamily enzyme YgiQ (UPF0313 family) [Natranaerovirga pectinivora]